MKDNLNDIHAEIAEIQSRDKERITKISLQHIPEIPEKDWEELKEKLYSGDVRVREMTTSPISFQLFAAPSDMAGFKFFNILALLLPVVAVTLAVLYSWWFVLLAIGSVFLLRIAKGFYRTVIFQGVTASEAAFCFLFSRNTICLERDGQLVYRNNE
ncbi:MAG: hypothetical protein K8I04_06820 [Gammaproteobacteria bacterium]|nr:hypothetical protein [Gammaproteobacteria bacterium]